MATALSQPRVRADIEVTDEQALAAWDAQPPASPIRGTVGVAGASRASGHRDKRPRSDRSHEKAMFAVFQVAVMLKKLKADYYAAWHGERRPT